MCFLPSVLALPLTVFSTSFWPSRSQARIFLLCVFFSSLNVHDSAMELHPLPMGNYSIPQSNTPHCWEYSPDTWLKNVFVQFSLNTLKSLF